jgi:hypothetical protein
MNNPMFRKGLSIAALGAILTGSLASCSPSVNPAAFGGPAVNGNTRINTFSANRNGKKKWTIAIHMAADNNLYSAGLDDLNEIEKGLAAAPGGEDINVVVLFDGARQGDSAIYLMKPDSRPYPNNEIISQKIDSQGLIPASNEIDSGDPAVFARFADFVTKNFPADHHSISLWNHGAGFPGGNGRTAPRNPALANQPGSFLSMIGGPSGTRAPGVNSRSFASDDNGGEMHVRDLNPALAAGMKNIGKPFDILGFDTCLQGHLEVAYQALGQADYLVASEELEPGDGWDYAAYIGALAQNPNMNGRELASAMVDTYVKSYMPGGAQRGSDITLSAIDITALGTKLVPALNAYAAELTASLPTNKAGIEAARKSTQMFYNRDAADLGHFLKLYPASRSGAAAQAAYAQTVVREGHYGPAKANSTGIAIYFPYGTMTPGAAYFDTTKTRFAETKAWGTFLKALTAR